MRANVAVVNATHGRLPMSLFARTEQAPADPILGLTEAFHKDQRSDKVNLGVGVYLDESGAIPLMDAVRQAQEQYVAAQKPHGYLPIDGLPAYREQTRALIFGDDAHIDNVTTVQSLSGTGALRIGGELLKQLSPDSRLLLSNPSWENHRALFTQVGFDVDTYTYYDADARGIDFAGMLDDLQQAKAGTVVVLHACCHNPTGYDLTDSQWDQVVQVIGERELVAFVDMAYQGFGDGPDADAALVGKLMTAKLPFLLATSYSKNFGLYGQRTGALHVAAGDADEATRVLSQLKLLIRKSYSNPPAFGANVVATVLGDAGLRASWETELQHMRERIASLRTKLVEHLAAQDVDDMDFIAEQRGMFSYCGLTRDQMQRLRAEHGVYGTDAGRLCVAALNDGNIEKVASAIANVRG